MGSMMGQRRPYILALFIGFFLFSCGESIEPGTTKRSPPTLKGVSVAVAQVSEQPDLYEAVGTVTAGISSKLASKLLGTVEAVRVREGDLVKRGDPLVIIDQRQVNARLHEARAGLSEARRALAAVISARDASHASEKLALATYERYLNLKKEDSVTSQEFDEVEARYRQAKAAFGRAKAMVQAASARVEQAKAALSAALVSSKDAVITAPHDGIITGKFVDEGDLATPGTPLVALETTQGFRVDVLLPETYIEQVQPGQKVGVSVPALKTGLLAGNVRNIVPSADPRSRSFILKITLPIGGNVRSGMFARVKIPMGHSKKLLIPQKAVITRGQLTGLYLVDADNVAHFRLVRLGRRLGDAVAVISGLKEGDRYVAEPTPALKDGSKLEMTP